MCNNSLFDRPGAPKMYRGSSVIPTIWSPTFFLCRNNVFDVVVDTTGSLFVYSKKVGEVGEHSYSTEAPAARRGGGMRRENVGMSNHNPNEKLEPRKSKVSEALAINLGLGGPKAMAKAAADG